MEEEIQLYINLSDSEKYIAIPEKGSAKVLSSNNGIGTNDKQNRVAPKGYVIIKSSKSR